MVPMLCPSWQDTPCTANFAAAMARASRSPLVQRYYPEAAGRYLARARQAWNFLQTQAPWGVSLPCNWGVWPKLQREMEGLVGVCVHGLEHLCRKYCQHLLWKPGS